MKGINVGNYNIGTYGTAMGKPVRITDSAIESNRAFLISELEKRNPDIVKPLSAVTFTRDVPVEVGGGWVDGISNINIDYGISGGSIDGNVIAGSADTIPVIQGNLGKDVFKTHLFSAILRVPYIDMMKSNYAGRSLDELLTTGIRLNYDKHLDANCYVGVAKFNTTGLVNNANVVQEAVDDGVSGYKNWKSKTPEEILEDINTAITETWEACGYDLDALPNHILLPHEQYAYIATQKVSPIAEKTILTFILENNITKINGGNLVIGATPFCKEAGATNTDRMVVYVYNPRFVKFEELVPLFRALTSPNTNAFSYDSVYAANLGEVEIKYIQSIRYYDGI